jgi:hypothetical protein
MKSLFFTLFILISLTFFSSCAEQQPPVAELEQVTREYIAKDDPSTKVRGISLQPYPNNVYLITVDAESKEGKSFTRLLIGQLYNGDGKSYWQAAPATKHLLKALNIKKPKDDDEE